MQLFYKEEILAGSNILKWIENSNLKATEKTVESSDSDEVSYHEEIDPTVL